LRQHTQSKLLSCDHLQGNIQSITHKAGCPKDENIAVSKGGFGRYAIDPGGLIIMSQKKPRKANIRAKNIASILQSAEQEFVFNGYKGTTMQKIADRSQLPKANVHYYFKNKISLYTRLLEKIIERWNDVFNEMTPNAEPATALRQLIKTKMELSHKYPEASRIFAMEIIQGAPHLQEYLKKDMRHWLEEKTKVIQKWIADGKMDEVDPVSLIFLIWSSTQHYADSSAQILAMTNKNELNNADFNRATDFLCQIILKGCGIT